MILILLAYLGGVLTILSPCILPVLPFVFARADRSFLRSGLPLLAGMALTFALVATLAAVGGGWVVEANRIGRWAALLLLALFALTLVFPALADRAMQPLVGWGSRLSEAATAGTEPGRERIGPSLLLGVATGLLWAPCAGPILGIILTGAALSGATLGTTVLLLAYALGAATSLALALLIGGRVFKAMKRSLGAGQWVRRVLGVVILVAVAAIALGLDTAYLTRLSAKGTFALEQGVASRLGEASGGRMTEVRTGPGNATLLPDEGPLPALDGAVQWLNSPPLTREQLRGKVVLVDFWTYSCINCLRAIPYVRAWDERYRKAGLVVIGVHAPEFAFERDPANVRRAMVDLGIRYPVAIDNDKAIWKAFANQYWPATYIADAKGRLRYHHFGEGDDETTERAIRQLLMEAGAKGLGADPARVRLGGVSEQADFGRIGSRETYLGFARAANFASPGGQVRDRASTYALPPLRLNQWGLGGAWTVGAERVRLDAPGGRIAFRFRARDLNLVLGAPGRPVRFKVTVDGAAPGADRGVDADAAGQGVVAGQRLYQLVRQQGPARERLFTIEFLDPGVEAYAFTFG
ncbi:MAG: cytochrome c biogenesis protein DipZ [Alphaproteobacteria bacterium]|nr:cytochrome c biogenesis protein DipZ [Alphaproteobacteria bacterium]MBV9370847.1 cytochrome c biogenesis protein DipZ [Alphaproteobacteria bacterium]MBV9901278.1 cytochrome c biogenesis protein DipZ [Alphaproteobacteria bacterium]